MVPSVVGKIDLGDEGNEDRADHEEEAWRFTFGLCVPRFQFGSIGA